MTVHLFRRQQDAVAFSAGSVIFKEGDEPNHLLYAVIEGQVDIKVGNLLIETVEEGGVFGEMGLIDPEPRSATAIARTDCRLVPVDEKRFHFMVQETPNFALIMMRILVRRLRHMNEIEKGKS